MFNIYYADYLGREGNCLYPHKAEVTDAASLAQAVGHDYVCAEYKNSYTVLLFGLLLCPDRSGWPGAAAADHERH